MNRPSNIKNFEFDSARYRLDDGRGNQARLHVDYKK